MEDTKKVEEAIKKAKDTVEKMNLEEPYKSITYKTLLDKFLSGKIDYDVNNSSTKTNDDIGSETIDKTLPQQSKDKLSFNAEDIELLKTEIVALGDVKSKRAALQIAKFISERKGRENFLSDDLDECYTLLKKVGVTNIPPIKNMKQLVIDTYNKNKWFEKNSDGTYKISGLGYHTIAKNKGVSK